MALLLSVIFVTLRQQLHHSQPNRLSIWSPDVNTSAPITHILLDHHHSLLERTERTNISINSPAV